MKAVVKYGYGKYETELRDVPIPEMFYAAACGTAGCECVEAFTLCTDWPIIAGAHKLLP